MKYTEINELFKSLNISYKNNVWKIGANRNESTVIASMVEPRLTGITVKEAMDLFTNPPKTYIDVPILSGLRKLAKIESVTFDYSDWNKVDEFLFNRIFFTINPIDQSLMLLIKSGDDEYRPVMMGGSRAAQITSLASICNEVKVDDEHTYNQWLTGAVRLMNERMNTACMAIFNDTSISTNDKIPEIISYLNEKYSASILHRRNNAYVLYKTLEVDSDEKVMTPLAMRVLDNLSNPVNIYSHILDSIDILAQRMDRKMQMPTPYSSVKGVKCFRYLDVDQLMTVGEHPTWDFYMKRYTHDEGETLKAFIFSIFFSKNAGRQMLYIYDNGFNGKTAVNNAIGAYIGDDLCAAIQKNSLNNFGLAKVWDKRLITIDDNKNPQIVRSEIMHMILGGGRAEIEMKGKNSFTAKLSAKVIVCGNTLPEIDTSATHEMTRLIIIKPKVNAEILEQIAAKNADGSIMYDSYGKPVLLGDEGFSERLKIELPAFLTECKQSYVKMCPTNANFILPESLMDELYNLGSSECIQMDTFISKELVVDATKYIEKQELFELYMSCSHEYRLDPSNMGYSNFVAHLSKSHPIKATRTARPERTPIFAGVGLAAGNFNAPPKPYIAPISAKSITEMMLGED